MEPVQTMMARHESDTGAATGYCGDACRPTARPVPGTSRGRRVVRMALTAGAMLVATFGTGCATGPEAAPERDDNRSIEGEIISIDTSPWMYDGNAVVIVETGNGERTSVQLPARWNLCKAAPVDVDALRVGMRVLALGSTGEEGEVVVCQHATHRLVPAR